MMTWRGRWRLIVIGLLLFFNLAVWYLVWSEDRRGQVTIAFLDVGQGDAILIDSPTGNQVLVDAGPPAGGPALRALGQILPFYDRTIDLIVATHPDADHIGGFPAILARYQVDGLLEPGIGSETQAYQALERAAPAEGLKRVLARRGQKIMLGGGAELDIWYPTESAEQQAEAKQDTNAASIVAELIYGQNRFMLTGDAPQATERFLLSQNESLAAEVLKLGHHGSRTSSAPDFVAAVHPRYVIISAGANNRYGHPHPETLATLKQQNIPALATAERGTIVFRSDGTVFTFK